MGWGESLARRERTERHEKERLAEELDESEAMLIELGNAASGVIWFMMLAELETWDISHGGTLVREQFLSFYDTEIGRLSRALQKVRDLDLDGAESWPCHDPS